MKIATKKVYVGITACIILPILAIGTIFSISDRPNIRSNSFLRTFTPNEIVKRKYSELPLEYPCISGIDEHFIYFADTIPGRILKTDYNLNGEELLNFSIKDMTKLYPFGTCVSNNNFYHLAKISPAIIQYNLMTKNVTEYKLTNNFNQCVNVSPVSFIAKVLVKKSHGFDFYLSKIDLSGHLSIVDSSLLPYKTDGGFYNDGVLLFDKSSYSILFVAYYRNEFICLDTNLNLSYRGKTIDTFSNTSVAVIKERLDTSWSYTMSKPPKLINRKSNVDNGLLYIQSNIKADNEATSDFKNNSVIDVYNIKNGVYLHSFYLPHFDGKEVTDYRIKGNMLTALYDKSAVIYYLNPAWFR